MAEANEIRNLCTHLLLHMKRPRFGIENSQTLFVQLKLQITPNID